MSIGCPLDAFNYTPIFMGLQYIFWDFYLFWHVAQFVDLVFVQFYQLGKSDQEIIDSVSRNGQIYIFLYSNELGM